MKNVVRVLLAILVAGTLAGCSTNFTALNASTDLESFRAALREITTADLDAATARAVAGGDKIGAMCYPVIKKYVAQGVTGTDKVAGVFDAFEKARLGAGKIASVEVPEDLRIACAPLYLDSRDLALRIAAMVRKG